MAKQAMKYEPGRGRELAGSLCAQIAHYLSERVYSQANKNSTGCLAENYRRNLPRGTAVFS